MGLDLHAYRGLEKVGDVFYKDHFAYSSLTGQPLSDADYEQYFIPMIEPEWAAVAGSLSEGLYRFEEQRWVSSLSYSGVWDFRGVLAKIGGYIDEYELGSDPADFYAHVQARGAGPFYEFIILPDDSGLLGPESCRKLYQDFLQFAQSEESYLDETDFIDSYDALQAGLKFVGEYGCIVLR